MRMPNALVFCATLIAAMAGCSPPAEQATAPEAAPSPVLSAEPPEAAPAPAPVATPAADPAPAVALPEGFTARFHVHPEMILTGAETVNAENGEYKVTGELRASALQVLDYFVKYFQDNGWEEDMVMEQEGNAVVSFKKDGHLQYVDSQEGGIGAKITITTGKV